MLQIGRSLSSQSFWRSYSQSSSDVRSSFIRYFEGLGHDYVPSSSVLPNKDDDSLLFVNAGMNQFKSIFLGTVEKDSPFASIKRAVNSQRCLRVGGKHNDLDDVGVDDYHHTLFEMLGNWSFGDYYKKEACEYAWKYLTDVLHLDPSRLYVSYFGGDSEMNLEPDTECREIWLRLGIPESHIVTSDAENNFWTMGDTGPCGPCSEIHYDRRAGRRNAADLVNKDDPEMIELWNIVFMQFERKHNGSIHHLNRKYIDCGMGFERLVSVVQNKGSSYDTDLFVPLMNCIQKNSRVEVPYSGKVGCRDVHGVDAAYRIVADHMRGTLIALADGVKPKGVDQGFCVRKMLRRAAQQSVDVLKADRYSLSSLVPTFCEHIEAVYPGLTSKSDDLKNIVAKEEKSYWKIKDTGSKTFYHMAQAVKGCNEFPARDAFFLHNSIGFTIDMTNQLAALRGLSVNMEEFKRLQLEASEKSRRAHRIKPTE
uniref:alanine--tRNA ligase n=1 Tax=Steinernema glaseri TaxID=37863 RepID=A0A1I7YEN8_9BILA